MDAAAGRENRGRTAAADGKRVDDTSLQQYNILEYRRLTKVLLVAQEFQVFIHVIMSSADTETNQISQN
jgi:hypothetical protein